MLWGQTNRVNMERRDQRWKQKKVNISLLSPFSVVRSALWCLPWWWHRPEGHLQCRHLSLRPRWRRLSPAEPPCPESEEHAAHPPCSWNQSVEGETDMSTPCPQKKLDHGRKLVSMRRRYSPGCLAVVVAWHLLIRRPCMCLSGRSPLGQNCTLLLCLHHHHKMLQINTVIKRAQSKLCTIYSLDKNKLVWRKQLQLKYAFFPLLTESFSPFNKVLTLFIQPSDDVVDVVGEKPPAVQDGGQHGCDGSAGHHLIVWMFIHLRERRERLFFE